jgi:hypothetical protein
MRQVKESGLSGERRLFATEWSDEAALRRCAYRVRNSVIDRNLRDSPLGDIPKRLLLQRHLHIHVYCGTIHNSQVMETAKMPQH